MNADLFENLFKEGYISADTLEKIRRKRQNPLFSLHWELKTLLYLGVMLLSSGLGILIYKNIDTIGHQAILACIAAISMGCFYYCYRHKRGFSREMVKSTGPLFDYLLLLGCLSFLSFLGYLQFQYAVFGDNYGLATFIPMLVLFYVAYEFDHLGILSMAITNLGVWLGLSVNPLTLMSTLDHGGRTLIFLGLLLGILLVSMAFLSERINFKKHFHFTYLHFGTHVTFIAMLYGYFYDFESEISILWILPFAAFAWYIYKEALKHKSFYFLLLCTLYTYIVVSALIVRYLLKGHGIGVIYIGLCYFIISAFLFIRLLVHMNKKIKAI